jgi:CBS domain-containing protein
MLTAFDVMSRNPTTVQVGASLGDAVRLMLDRRVSGLPVIDAAGRVAGMLTEGDLLRRAETGTERQVTWLQEFFLASNMADRFVQTHGRQVQDLMTHDVASVEESTPLSTVVSLMQNRRIKRLPVLRNGVLVGIVARADLLRALASVLEHPADALDDEAIRIRLTGALHALKWVPVGISVTVLRGVVELSGILFNEHDRAAMRVAAENIPGVVAVRDHLIFVEPNSGIVIEPTVAPA